MTDSCDAEQAYAQDYWRKSIVSDALPVEAGGALGDDEFRVMADAMPVLCWLARSDGYIVWYNRRWHDYCGSTPQQMEGWGWQSVHDPDRVDEVSTQWSASIASGTPFEMVFPLRGADGVLRPFLTRISPIRNASGEIVRWYGVNVEVSAQLTEEARRDVVEVALRAAKLERDFVIQLASQQRSLSEPQAIMALSSEMLARRLGVHRACFYRLLTPTHARYVGCWSDGTMIHLSGDTPNEHLGVRVVESRRRGEMTSNSDTREEGHDEAAAQGILAAVDIPLTRHGRTIGGLYVNHGEVRAWGETEIALVREVAELTWLAVERAEALLRVEDRVARQQRQLDVAADKLSTEQGARSAAEGQVRQLQKMEAVGQLTGGIAHDFNNMLAVIIGGLNLMQRRLDRGDTDVGKYIEGAMEGATRAAALTHRLLAFSRQSPLAPETIDINRLVTGLHDLLTRTLGERIELESAQGAGLWRCTVDPNQLENVIVNLSVNARDAMPDGGKLTIETSNVHVDEAYAREYEIATGQYVMLAITDTGTGMPADVVAKAFDPFFTTKGVGKGTGLGLSQVFGFVRQSGGNVKIYSESGHGTTIKVYLPRSYGNESGVQPRKLAGRAGPGDPTEIILVVEDEERVRNFSVEALRELGYTVLHAANGAEALSILARGQDVTLLFTDIVMPEMTGRQLADQAVTILPKLKVIYTTGYTRNAVVHNGVLDPGTNFLPKPFGIDELSAKIRSVLDG